jgi:hypothetical protein
MAQQLPSTPSNLSPQAWAVLEAAYKAPDGRNATRQTVAAALRAAANELGYRIIFDDGETEYRIDVTDLLAIAGELEAQ